MLLKRLKGLILLSLVGLLGVQALFAVLQEQSAETTEASVRALIRDESVFSDTLALTRQMDDLSTLGLLRCTVLTRLDPTPVVFVDDRAKGAGCQSSLLFLRGAPRSVEMRSLNGARWRLAFISVNQSSFTLSLWLARALVLLITIGATLWYWARLDAKQLALRREEENGRLLEERVREQAQVIATLKIDSAVERSLNELAAQVSHDIRSPLSALNLVVKNLSELPEDKRRLIEQVSERINGIANDLLKRYKASRLKAAAERAVDFQSRTSIRAANLVPTPVAELLERLYLEKSLVFATRENVHLQLDLREEREAVCLLDRTEFARVLSNLVNNAVEALEGGGEVRVALRSSVKEVSVIVTDNGRGIPQELLARLGRERVSAGKEGTESGSGLGLWHARSAVEAMGGSFFMQSRVGLGTQVTMRFARVGQSLAARAN